jgi:hypothetical protein
LPVGYVYDPDQQVVFDPDEQIRGVVADLFAEFDRTGSACAVVAAFAKAGRLFPQRAYGGVWAGQLRWGKLTHSRVVQPLHNPGYAGAYTYGRSHDLRRVTPDGASGRRRRPLPLLQRRRPGRPSRRPARGSCPAGDKHPAFHVVERITGVLHERVLIAGDPAQHAEVEQQSDHGDEIGALVPPR